MRPWARALVEGALRVVGVVRANLEVRVPVLVAAALSHAALRLRLLRPGLRCVPGWTIQGAP